MELKPSTRQVLLIQATLLNVFCLGFMFGYPSIIIPSLKDKGSDIQADVNTISWIVAIPGLSGFATSILIGPLMNSWGRKKTHLLITACGLIGWILAAASYSIHTLLLARVFQGVTKGSTTLFGVCIAEFSSPKRRGVLINWNVLVVTTGMATAHLIGLFMHWRHSAIVGIVASLVALLVNIMWTDTPESYIQRNNYKKAKEVFYQLRERNSDSEKEITKMIEAKQGAPQRSGTLKVLMSKQFWMIALLVASKQLIMECGGRHYFSAYLTEIVTEITGDKSKSIIYVFVIDLVCIAANLLSCFLINRISRRNLLIYPGCLTIFLLLSLSFTMFLHHNFFHTKMLLYIVTLLVGLYFFIVNSTMFTLCFVIASEIWPLEFRHIGVVYHSLIACVVYTIWMKLMPILTQSIHLYGALALSAVIISCNVLHFYKCLPETRNKTLHDIGEFFNEKRSQIEINPDSDKERQTFLEKP